MKELYISPELEILCFLPMEGIASSNINNFDIGLNGARSNGGLDNGLSDSDYQEGDYNETEDTGNDGL